MSQDPVKTSEKLVLSLVPPVVKEAQITCQQLTGTFKGRHFPCPIWRCQELNLASSTCTAEGSTTISRSRSPNIGLPHSVGMQVEGSKRGHRKGKSCTVPAIQLSLPLSWNPLYANISHFSLSHTHPSFVLDGEGGGIKDSEPCYLATTAISGNWMFAAQ